MAWTSGARSVATLSGDGWFTFDVGAPIGVVIGLATHDESALPIDIDFGLRLTDAGTSTVSRDLTLNTGGTYPANTIYKCAIGRVSGVLFASFTTGATYSQVQLSNGAYVPGGTYLYEIPTIPTLTGELFIDASLYASTDTVKDLTLVNRTFGRSNPNGGVKFLPMTANGTAENVAAGSVNFAPMTTSGVSSPVGSGSVLFRLTATGISAGTSSGRAMFEPMTAEGYASAFNPNTVSNSISFQPMTAAGSGLTGDARGTAMFLPLAVKGSTSAYSEGRALFKPMVAAGAGMSTGAAGYDFSFSIPALTAGLSVGIVDEPDAEGAAVAVGDPLPESTTILSEVLTVTDELFRAVTTVLDVLEVSDTREEWRTGSSGDQIDSATASDELVPAMEMLAEESASVSDELVLSTLVTVDQDDANLLVDGFVAGSRSDFTDTVAATDTRFASATIVFNEVATATGEADLDLLLRDGTLSDQATALSELFGNSNTSAFLSDELWAQSAVVSLINNAMAWVMNSESTAVTWYVNWPFTDMAQRGERTYAIGPAGLYTVGGDSDAGGVIRASIEYDFTDFGGYDRAGNPTPSLGVHRVDTVHVGSTHGTPVKLNVQVQGGPTYSYLSERPPSNTPRNDRFTPGKGLRGRYWKIGLENTAGGDFSINDITVDVASNNRRL